MVYLDKELAVPTLLASDVALLFVALVGLSLTAIAIARDVLRAPKPSLDG